MQYAAFESFFILQDLQAHLACESSFRTGNFLNGLNNKIKHTPGHPGENANPECVAHDTISVLKISNHPIPSSPGPHLIKTRMFDYIAGKKHPGLYAILLKIILVLKEIFLNLLML